MKTRTLAIIMLSLSLPILAEAQMSKAITKSQAAQAAMASVKGGKVLSGKYEMEGGRHVWSFDIRTAQAIKEVWVDPVSGMVIKIQNESMAHEKTGQSRDMKAIRKRGKTEAHHSSQKQGITRSAAEKLAMKAAHGTKVVSILRLRKDKINVWSVDVKTANGTKSVWLSPENGRVLKISNVSGKMTSPKK